MVPNSSFQLDFQILSQMWRFFAPYLSLQWHCSFFGRIERKKSQFEINWLSVRLFPINHALLLSARSKSHGEAWRCVVKNVMPQLFLSLGFSNPLSMWRFLRVEKQTKYPFEINWSLARLFLINHALLLSARSKSHGEAWRCVVKNVMPQLFLSTGFSNPFSMWRFFAAYLSLQWHRDLRMMAVKKSYYTS